MCRSYSIVLHSIAKNPHLYIDSDLSLIDSMLMSEPDLPRPVLNKYLVRLPEKVKRHSGEQLIGFEFEFGVDIPLQLPSASVWRCSSRPRVLTLETSCPIPVMDFLLYAPIEQGQDDYLPSTSNQGTPSLL